jgi:ABC-type Fe3+ transport system permease subunit
MNASGILVIAVVLIVICFVAVVLDRLLDSAVGGSYALVQRAGARRGLPWFRLALGASVILAVSLTIGGILANWVR